MQIAPLFQRWKGASKNLKTHLLQKIPDFALLGKSLRNFCDRQRPELFSVDQNDRNCRVLLASNNEKQLERTCADISGLLWTLRGTENDSIRNQLLYQLSYIGLHCTALREPTHLLSSNGSSGKSNARAPNAKLKLGL